MVHVQNVLRKQLGGEHRRSFTTTKISTQEMAHWTLQASRYWKM